MVDLKERFEACMVLAGVGDAIGYKNAEWEFCKSGVLIHEQLDQAGGIENIKVDPQNWMVSDDTVMHIATADALVSDWSSREHLFTSLATHYKECMNDMLGRQPGTTCTKTIALLRPAIPKGYIIPFNPRGAGCGGAMRSAPIGLLYHKPEQIEELVAVAVESGRMSHNHPIGFLGSLATALFVSYAIQCKPLHEWGAGLVQTLDLAMQYVERTGRDVTECKENWHIFKDAWTKYLTNRGILSGQSEPVFPGNYDVAARDKFYKTLCLRGGRRNPGACGHDAPMIAYDALLSCGNSWLELCLRGMLHGGDSDSTGIIAAACWGAMNGYEGVPVGHYEKLEYLERLKTLAEKLYRIC